ncbi:Trypsin [Popillia japonica]|uniref:Trypsin n=1 Tax=Popillia japonica TaxID=7064 RepID=A0AAW1L3F6_POPJA
MFSFIVLLSLYCPLLCISQQIGSSWNPNRGYDDRSFRNTGNSFCPPNTECVPISQCPILSEVLNNDCVFTSKIGKLGCGFQGSGLVCCPQSSESTLFTQDAYNSTYRPKCGQSSIQGDRYEGLGAYPWVVRVGFRNTLTGEIKYPCTGTILDKRVILTAAHCALAKASNFKLFTVKVGEWLSNSDIDCGDEFCGLPAADLPVSHIIVHPNYQKETYRNNIALLVLRQPINYTVTAQPICLPETWLLLPNNAVLVGWGKAAGQLEASPQQQAIRVPIASIQQCSKVYGNTLPINDEQLCAGGEAGRDACSGFGGAPLLIRQTTTYYQIGILSFGSDQCGAPGIPSVYTDVRKYTGWIRENTPLSYNYQ